MRKYKLDPNKVFPGSVLTPPPKTRRWVTPNPAPDILEFQQERWKQSVEDALDRWDRLTAEVDYHTGSWWVLDELDDWVELPKWQIDDVLLELGIGQAIKFTEILDDDGRPTGQFRRIPDEEREYIKMLFRRRNDEAHRMGRLPEGPEPTQAHQPPADSQMDLF